MSESDSAQKRSIYVVGPSSTGKTTLCDALAKKLDLQGTAYVTEVAREVMQTHGFTRNDIGLVQMQLAIMNAHIEREEGGACAIQLCDRSAIDPIVYAVFTAPNENEAKRRQNILVNCTGFQRILQHYRSSTFILLAPVDEWVFDDGVRSIENQSACYEVYRRVLGELQVLYREFGLSMRYLPERVVVAMSVAGLV